MIRPGGPPVRFARLAVGFNLAAAVGCIVLVALAPSRAAVVLAIGGFAFFGLAGAGFALMLRLRGGASRGR